MTVKLGMRIGVTPSGPDGKFTRRDHLRGAGYSALVALALAAIAAIVLFITGEKLDGIHAGIVVMCSFGLWIAGMSCLVSLLRAAVGR